MIQQEATAYCNVTKGATIKRREVEGLKKVWKGNSRRYRAEDLKRFLSMKNRGKIKQGR